VRRGYQAGMSPLRAGLIAIVVIVVGVYFAFAKSVPFHGRGHVQAVFRNSNLLQVNSPVRISGIDVGKVAKVSRYKRTGLALVTLDINPQGRPIHSDATLKIRPRLFLEGNFYVDLKPGTPAAPDLKSGALIPLAQTSRPVQLDQVLTSLQAGTRAELGQTIQGFGAAVDAPPTAADDASQDPDVRGLTGAQALNNTLDTSPQALRDSALVQTALLGSQPHDLSRLIAGFARASRGLATNEGELADLVSNFNTTVAALAAQAPALRSTVQLLGPTAASAARGFASLDRALPATRKFARDLVPGVQETPATIAAADPWIAQARPLLGERELGGLLDELSPATGDLARLGASTRKFLPAIDQFNRCVTSVILPTGNIEVQDGSASAGVENYKEFWYALVGEAGEGQLFDGNGPLLRLDAASGSHPVETGNTNIGDGPLFANVALPPLATRPAYTNKLPPLRRDVPCYTQPVPNVNGQGSIGPSDGSKPGAPPPPLPKDPSATASVARLVSLSSLGKGGR
jgi:phospholipid/cholesterol/gamma-HCH transport system substrate-binding protein